MCLLPDLAPSATCSSELDGDSGGKDVIGVNGSGSGNNNNYDCYDDDDCDDECDEDGVDESGGLDAAKHDVLYRANYISAGFELANDLISEMSQLEPLNGAKAKSFLEKVEELRIRNESVIKELIGTSDECRAVLEQLNVGINKYVDDLINENEMLNNTENKMDMTLGEMYDIYN